MLDSLLHRDATPDAPSFVAHDVSYILDVFVNVIFIGPRGADHVGTLHTLAHERDVPVFAHSLERPYLIGQSAYPPMEQRCVDTDHRCTGQDCNRVPARSRRGSTKWRGPLTADITRSPRTSTTRVSWMCHHPP